MSGLDKRLRRLEERFARVEEMQSLAILVQFVNAEKEVVRTLLFEIGKEMLRNRNLPATRRTGGGR